MSLANFMKPRHLHSDAGVRARAMDALTDEAILVLMACEDPDLELEVDEEFASLVVVTEGHVADVERRDRLDLEGAGVDLL